MNKEHKSNRIVYFMRGLPSCGKSYTAKKLAGKEGVVLETDAYFFTEVGTDPLKFSYDRKLLETARQWVFNNLKKAIEGNISPIIIDRGNGLGRTTQLFAQYAVDKGYTVEIMEPESDHWQEIRVLLKYKDVTRPILKKWAKKLSKMNRSTHRTGKNKIQRRMDSWVHDLKIQDVLSSDFKRRIKSTPRKKIKEHKPPLFSKTGTITFSKQNRKKQ